MLYRQIDCWLIIKLSKLQLIATSAIWANDSLNFLLANTTNMFYNMVALSESRGRDEAGGAGEVLVRNDGGQWQYQDRDEVRGMVRAMTVPRRSRCEDHGEGDDSTKTESRWGAWRWRWQYQDRVEVRGMGMVMKVPRQSRGEGQLDLFTFFRTAWLRQ